MIVRVHKAKNYLVMDKTGLDDPRLSLQAKGLLAYLLGRPDHWKPIVCQLTKTCTNGKASIATAIRNLEECHYIWKRPDRRDGKLDGWEYHVFEVPHPESPFVTASEQLSDFQLSDSQLSENQSLVSIEEPVSIESSKKPLHYPPEFESIWKIYPVHMAKKKVYESWSRAKKAGWTDEQLEMAVKNYLKYLKVSDVQAKWGQGFFNPDNDYIAAWQDDGPGVRELIPRAMKTSRGMAPISEEFNQGGMDDARYR